MRLVLEPYERVAINNAIYREKKRSSQRIQAILVAEKRVLDVIHGRVDPSEGDRSLWRWIEFQAKDSENPEPVRREANRVLESLNVGLEIACPI